MKFLLLLLISVSSLAETTFTKNALPIFKNRCSSCHNAEMMPDKNWLNYDIAKSYKDLILKRAWTLKDMPPGNTTNITDEERKILKNWVEEGAKK